MSAALAVAMVAPICAVTSVPTATVTVAGEADPAIVGRVVAAVVAFAGTTDNRPKPNADTATSACA